MLFYQRRNHENQSMSFILPSVFTYSFSSLRAHKPIPKTKTNDSTVTTPSQLTDDAQSQLTEEDEIEETKVPAPPPAPPLLVTPSSSNDSPRQAR